MVAYKSATVVSLTLYIKRGERFVKSANKWPIVPRETLLHHFIFISDSYGTLNFFMSMHL